MADIAGPLLVRAGLITQAQLLLAQKARGERGGTVSEHLVALGALDEESLCNFYRQRLLVPRVGMAELGRVPPQVIRRIPADMAAEFRIVPIEYDREQNLIIAMAEPSDTHAIDEIGFFTGSFVMRAVAPASAIAWALANYYGINVPLAAPHHAPRHVPPVGSSPLHVLEPIPTEVSQTTSGAVIVDHPRPIELTASAKVIVSAESNVAAQAPRPKKRAPAQIVEDVFGEDTPLPQPIPFDNTSPVPLVELTMQATGQATGQATAQAATPEVRDGTPVIIPDDPAGQTIPNAMPPPPPLAAPILLGPASDTPMGTAPAATAPAVTAPAVTAPAATAQAVTAPAAASPSADEALAFALEQLRFASDRDEVAAVLVLYLGRLCRRAALFVVRKGTLSGWLGHGENVHTDELREASLALDAPSSFRDVVNSRLPFHGPVIDTPSRDFLIDALGWAPDRMLAIPITLRERVVSVLYGDGYLVPIPEDHLAQVARTASAGLERALALKKST